MSMEARSQDMIANNQLSTDDYHRSLRSDMQLHEPHRHAYPIGHSQSTGPYPLHLTGVAGTIDMRQRESGAAGALLHSGAGGGAGGSGSRSSNNMGMMSASSSASSGREGYPDVAVARQCEREGCSVQPSYGKVWKKPRFCARHKLPGMMDVRNRRCEEPGCTRQPSYGKEGQRRQFCFTHKREGDVDVKSTRCKSTGCPKHAMYGRPGEMPQYCSAHKAEDMVDVKKRRRCNADGCERRASYALEGEKAAFCSAHKQPGHVNVNNRRCEYQGCSRRPVFSFQGEKPRFCVAHKLEGMLDSRLTATRGKGSLGRASQVAASQSRMHGSGGGVGGYPPPRPGVGRAGGGNGVGTGGGIGGVGGRMGHENEGDMMLAAAQAVMGVQSGTGGRLTGHVTRHAAAQATVSAAAAVIAAMEDEARLDYRAAHGGGGQGDRGGLRNGGAGFRDTEADMYETLHHGGAVGVTKPKTEVGGWTSALFAPNRGDGASWDPTRPTLNTSSGMGASLTHGHSEVWPPSAASSRGLAHATSLSGVSAGTTSGVRDGVSEVYRMSNVTSMGGGSGNGGGGGGSSSQYLDDRNSRGFLSSLSNGGAGGAGSSSSDFMSSFSSSGGGQQQQQQSNVWHGNDDGGSGNGGELQWERSSRPRPPPIPAPLPSSWGRAVGVSSSDIHGGRHIGMLPPPPTSNQQRLPSLLNSRRPGMNSPGGMGYGEPHGGMAGDARDGSSYEARSREQG